MVGFRPDQPRSGREQCSRTRKRRSSGRQPPPRQPEATALVTAALATGKRWLQQPVAWRARTLRGVSAVDAHGDRAQMRGRVSQWRRSRCAAGGAGEAVSACAGARDLPARRVGPDPEPIRTPSRSNASRLGCRARPEPGGLSRDRAEPPAWRSPGPSCQAAAVAPTCPHKTTCPAGSDDDDYEATGTPGRRQPRAQGTAPLGLGPQPRRHRGSTGDRLVRQGWFPQAMGTTAGLQPHGRPGALAPAKARARLDVSRADPAA